MKSTHKITTKTVYHNKWILLCFFVIFFQPLLVWNRVPFYYICEILQFMMWFLIFITQISEVKKWDIYLWVWTAFCCIQIVVISNNVGYSTANPEEAIERVLSLLFLVHFLDILFSRCRRREIVFFWKYLFCMLFLEIISILLYRMGVVNIYWLGIKTRATETIIAFLLLSLLLKDCIKKRWLHTGVVFSVVIVLLLKISTAIIGIVLIAGCLWLLKKPHLKWFLKLLQPSVIIGVTLTLTIGVLFFDIQTHISGLFSFAFSKDITFSGRTWFWEDGISKLAQYDQIHRLWGYGFHNISVWTSWTWIDFTSEAHNQLLQMLHDVGIIGTVMLYIIWFLQMHAIKKCNNKDIRNIIACTCFTFLIMCITEIYCYYPAFFVVFSIAARSEDIVENLNLHQFNWRNKT